MKKLFSIATSAVAFLFISFLIIKPVIAQKGEGGNKPIPDAVMHIAKKSCMNCHSKPGKFMALVFLNLTKWSEYSPKKQAKKAGAMCYMVTKDKMPPKKFKKSHPEGIPTKDEIKTICDWAQTLHLTKK